MLLAKVHSGGYWQPGIGDPSVIGWLIVGAYVLCLILCARCWLKRDRLIDAGRLRRYGLFWFTLSVVIAFLAINKQLDLQTLLQVTGRNMAIDEGWFNQRRAVQRGFIAGVGAAGVLSVLVMLWLMRGLWGRVGLSLVGIAVLVAFIVMRAASFHNMDDLLKQRVVGSIRMNAVMELSGIALVAGGAVLNLLWRKTGVKPASRGPT